MNRDPIEELFQKANNIKLDETRKAVMHQEISEFIKKNPLSPAGMKLPRFLFIRNAVFQRPAMAFASMMILLVAGSVATFVKADSALPGDFFYPAKLGINDKVKQVLAFSDEAKLKVNIDLAERRLQEIEQVAVKNQISESDQDRVRENLKDHASRASFYIDKLQSQKDDQETADIAAGFEASLKAHRVIIDGIGHGSKGDAGNAKAVTMFAAVKAVSPLVQDIDDITSNISGANIYHNDEAVKKSPDKKKAVEAKISAAEFSLKSAKQLVEKNKHKIGAQGFAQSEENLRLVQQKIDEGRKKLSESGDYKDSLSSLREASVIAEESKKLITRKVDLGVDVSININKGY
ncbi:hypothetical protein KW786_03600 [Candidatus Parcubacteria bacterium]|nr:hypothetical protein [Candidatus Parcubacteria bacterium]